MGNLAKAPEQRRETVNKVLGSNKYYQQKQKRTEKSWGGGMTSF